MSIIIEDIQIETLKNVGLSLVQAKVYLNLAKFGTANIKTIASMASALDKIPTELWLHLKKWGLLKE